MDAQFLINAFEKASDKLAIVWNGKEIKYGDLLNSIELANDFLLKNKILPGQVIALKGDFTPVTISFLIALINNQKPHSPSFINYGLTLMISESSTSTTFIYFY